MADGARVQLRVTLEPDRGDTIRGTVADGAGVVKAFNGWLELMSAFDAARNPADGDGDEAPGSGDA